MELIQWPDSRVCFAGNQILFDYYGTYVYRIEAHYSSVDDLN